MTTDVITAHDLGPFQRSALGAGTRRLAAVVEIPGATPEELRSAVAESVAAAPVLTARRVAVEGLLVPRQEPTSPEWTDIGDRLRLTAGTLRIDIAPSSAVARLTVMCDTLFADAASIGLLFAAIAGRSVGQLDFFDIAAGHNAMARSGELAEETAFWADAALRVPDGALTVAEAIPLASTEEPASIELDWAQVQAVAAKAETDVADLAHLALDVVVRRIGLPAQSVGITADARELMGLPDVIGPLTQVVPVPWRLDLAEDAVTALRARAEQRARTASMIGGPALESKRPAIVLDTTGGPALPSGWTLTSWSYLVDGEITLGMHRRGGAFVLCAESADAGVLLSMWGALLADLVWRPETRLGNLALVSRERAEELARALTAEVPPAPSLLERFRAHVAAAPDASAVRHGDTTWTYARLTARVNDIATALGELPSGSVVAVIADHEPDALAALLAVAWRSGTFIPLSPAEPQDRLRDAVERSGASMVLLGTHAQFSAGCRVIVLGEVPEGTEVPPVPVDPQQHAYVLRTSGSTGVPKLIGICWSSVDNYLRWAAQTWLADDAEMPVVSSPIFDASLKQTLGVLYAGRCVWMLKADRVDTAAARAELAAAGVPLVLNCVPSYLSVLLGESNERLPVRRFLCGGEALKPVLVARLREGWPDAQVWNLYGPTEATATATAGLITEAEAVTVGTPVAGAGVVAVDANGGVLPPGVRGELAITGPGLATGYLSGHEGESPFVRLDIGGQPIPVYRTGDLGVVSPTGAVSVLGRTDDQVKVNGWRIELGEIEVVAQGAPGVTDAVVVLDDRTDESRLRLFVTGDGSAVGESLRALLPAPMVPASITVLDRFDTTASGKVDRRALLRRVEEADQPALSDYDPVELEVATVWRDVVRHGWPRLDDDFFGVGGHSLLLARVVNILRARGHEQLSLRTVVRRPTVSSIAAAIRADS
jgi:amino acid adenylation domain-containing protein